MAVVLTILKILGIVLLCIIGLLLLILLMVLFIPIRYKLQGQYTEEAVGGDVNVRWFIIRFIGHFSKEDGFQGKAKIGFITIKNINVDPKKAKDGHAEPEIETTEQLPPPEPAEGSVTSKPPDTAPSEKTDSGKPDAVKPAGLSEEEKEAAEVFGSGVSEEKPETKIERKARKKREKEEAKARKAAAKAEPKPEKPPEERLGYKIEQFWNKIEKKRSHIEQFLEKDFTKRTIERGKKLIKKFFRHLKPKKGGIWLHVGLWSPADTGMILGKVARFYPLYGKWLFIEPDFYHKVIEVKGNVKGRIRLGSLGIPALIFYLRKDTRRTIKLAKKI